MKERIGRGMKKGGYFSSKHKGIGGRILSKRGFVALAATVILLGFGSIAYAVPKVAHVPANIKAWWTFDGPTSLGYDRAGNVANNGTTYGNLLSSAIPNTWWCDRFIIFDGIDDYIQVPHDSEIDVAAGDFSVDFWIRTTKDTGVQTIIDKRQSYPYKGYAVYLWNGIPGIQLANGVGTQYTNYNSSTSGWIADGNWHHVAVTVDRDQTNGLKFYIDGSMYPPQNPTNRLGSLSNTKPLRIGLNSFGQYRFSGDLDELDFVADVIPELLIKEIYNAGKWGKDKI